MNNKEILSKTLKHTKGDYMRQAFIECKCRKTAVRRCPWACKIVKVCGGYQAFESWSDYDIWKGAK